MIEERIREALGAGAARVVPGGDPGAEHLRRVTRRGHRQRRRRRFAIPAAALAVAAVALSPLLLRLPDGGRPVASAPPDLDPRYRPVSAVVDVGNGTSMWFTARRLCWRLGGGGGDCRGWNLPQGRHAGVVGVRSAKAPVTEDARTARRIVYGVADDQISRVAMTDGAATGEFVRVAKSKWRVWQITVDLPFPPSPADATKSVTFTSRDGSVTRANVAGAGGMVDEPRPLTTGVPLFTFQNWNGRPETMRAFRDGNAVGFGEGESHWVSAGKGPYFGGVGHVSDGPDAVWWYGFLAPRMARLTARLNDGRVLTARTFDLGGGQRVFAVRLPGVNPKKLNAAGKLVGYDADGAVLATWRI
ncbi:hypothetical protein [Actinomadura roseirufa]|uniref:hypothetical protein n=1 Tax=Actinomadura roseirufa TaxID=2094049 RepID=UPI001041A1E3|nr:hypothetical protein [Actinomadura roseirufa]